jgi:preprotein translocase subunit SecF
MKALRKRVLAKRAAAAAKGEFADGADGYDDQGQEVEGQDPAGGLTGDVAPAGAVAGPRRSGNGGRGRPSGRRR